MKIPIFEEILVKGTSVPELRACLEDTRIGRVPCFINLSNHKPDDLAALVINLEQVLLQSALHPRFPYPLYLVTGKFIESLFPTVRVIKDLPEHYFKKVKRPNNKEIQLLNKLSLKVDKLNNLELYKIVGELKDSAEPQRKLYNETKELHFLETLYSRFFEKTKPTKPGSV
jgi:hypothetical protein